jgi:hypothetical protein
MGTFICSRMFTPAKVSLTSMQTGFQSIFNELISIAAITFGLVQINKRSAADPKFSVAGISVKNLRIFAYIGIGLFILLIQLKL